MASYVADLIIDRAWRTPFLRQLLRTFDVHDPANPRMVTVLVFPSVEAAGLFRGTLAMKRRIGQARSAAGSRLRPVPTANMCRHGPARLGR